MVYIDEDFYYSEDENNEINLNEFLLEENEYQKIMNIISIFKNTINLEPEFYGIKNICAQEILNIIENTYLIKKISQNFKSKFSTYQINLFKQLYCDLNIDYLDENIIYSVIDIIFKKIYI